MNKAPQWMILGSYFVIGLMFAAGLALAGMTQPAKVVGFLDVTGDWDPSLGFVMAGGIATHLLFYKWVIGRPSPVFGTKFGIPTRQDLTPRLVGGAALFGIGWALAGYCPGPALVSAGSASGTGLVFVVAMLAGMGIFHGVDRYMQHRKTTSEAEAKAEAEADPGSQRLMAAR